MDVAVFQWCGVDDEVIADVVAGQNFVATEQRHHGVFDFLVEMQHESLFREVECDGVEFVPASGVAYRRAQA